MQIAKIKFEASNEIRATNLWGIISRGKSQIRDMVVCEEMPQSQINEQSVIPAQCQSTRRASRGVHSQCCPQNLWEIRVDDLLYTSIVL